jgi:hypothetical protein
MKPLIYALALVSAVLLLGGCSTLNRYGIGGDPKLICAKGAAFIDDKLAGSDRVRLSVVRRFEDVDKACAQ